MPAIDQEWAEQFKNEHGRYPTYDDYTETQRANDIRQDYPNLTDEQIYYITHPQEAPRDYWGGNEDQPAVTPAVTPIAIPEIKTWGDFATFYGSQPAKVDDMPDAVKAMQTGTGAESLWSKYLDVSMGNKSQVARDIMNKKFYDEFKKYESESGQRAVAGAEPLGWHNYIVNKLGEQGAVRQFDYLDPVQRGEQPWNFKERQRVSWR